MKKIKRIKGKKNNIYKDSININMIKSINKNMNVNIKKANPIIIKLANHIYYAIIVTNFYFDHQ